MSSDNDIMVSNKNIWICVLFIISTLFFLYQHSTGISWDFSVYVLNAKYLLDDGFYIEWSRAPLVPFIIGIFSVFGWRLAEYLYIVFVSRLFAFSSLKLARVCKIEPLTFYGLLVSPFVLNYGLSVGTELLFLSFLQLFVAYIHERNSAVFLSFAILTRYTDIPCIGLLLFKRCLREISIALFIIVLCISPWFLYNYYATGDPLTSMADAYALNPMFVNLS